MKTLKNIIIKIPVLGSIAVYIYKKMGGGSKFTTSGEYWENRYKSNGNSGDGSYNRLAEFKAEVINKFVAESKVKTVIEFGSGDGNQLKYFNFESYIGFDVSQTTISKCQNLYKSDSTKQFKNVKEYNNERAELVLSLDVIYHLVEDAVYSDYMEKLFLSSSKYVIVYSSNSDEHENNDTVFHVKHRKFTNWVEKNASNFTLIEHIPNKYSFNGDNSISSYADFYIFQIQD